MPRVLLPQQVSHGSLRNLSDYGELVYLFDERSLPPAIADNRLQTEIESRLLQLSFDPKVDFFAASGMMTLSHVVLASLVRQYGTVTCLLYDKELRRYFSKRLGT